MGYRSGQPIRFPSTFPDGLATARYWRGAGAPPKQLAKVVFWLWPTRRPAFYTGVDAVVTDEHVGSFFVCTQPDARKVTGRLASRPPGRVRRALRFCGRPAPR